MLWFQHVSEVGSTSCISFCLKTCKRISRMLSALPTCTPTLHHAISVRPKSNRKHWYVLHIVLSQNVQSGNQFCFGIYFVDGLSACIFLHSRCGWTDSWLTRFQVRFACCFLVMCILCQSSVCCRAWNSVEIQKYLRPGTCQRDMDINIYSASRCVILVREMSVFNCHCLLRALGIYYLLHPVPLLNGSL